MAARTIAGAIPFCSARRAGGNGAAGRTMFLPSVITYEILNFGLRENKPYTGSVSSSNARANTGKPRKIALFLSCGEYALKSLRLSKYGRIACHQMATGAISTAPFLERILLHPGPEKATGT